MEFNFRNVNDAYAGMVPWLVENGIKTDSRNGPVLRAPEPVTWTLERPWERVLLDPYRDANPFFHLYEGLWMIYGSNAVRPLCHFVKRMVDFTDDGATVPGAYGYRWQNKIDQWRPALATLANDPGTRRVVLAMYDPKQDTKALVSGGKDIPCNTHMYLTLREGKLCMTILNRSNDIEWGALGANAVHFSMVHEWASDILNVAEGPLTVFSNDLHKYLDRDIPPPPEKLEPYQELDIDCVPMGCQAPGWARDLRRAVRQGWQRNLGYDTPWFQEVFKPMMLAHNLYKEGHWGRAWDAVQKVSAKDWRLAGEGWLNARQPA